jgi:LmbE family N-acetylglucosaminyl deacetylase
MENQSNPSNERDQDELCAALRALGMLYGATLPPTPAIAGAADEAESIRAYIIRERPHLLAIYDMETLIGLVRAARAAHAESPSAIEQFSPG